MKFGLNSEILKQYFGQRVVLSVQTFNNWWSKNRSSKHLHQRCTKGAEYQWWDYFSGPEKLLLCSVPRVGQRSQQLLHRLSIILIVIIIVFVVLLLNCAGCQILIDCIDSFLCCRWSTGSCFLGRQSKRQSTQGGFTTSFTQTRWSYHICLILPSKFHS